MLNDASCFKTVYVVCGYTDLRSGMDRLAALPGANASDVVYTIVEMAKAHDLSIYGYLKFMLEHRPTQEMTDEQLAELAPWSEKLQVIKKCM